MARLTPFGVFLKWVMIPLALAGIGYFLIGPRLGKGVIERVQGLQSVRSLIEGADTNKASGPDVDVSVSRVADR